jgi:hypothetical protein
MSYGPCQVYTVGAASGASTSSYLDLGGKSYTKIAVNAVTMSTGAAVTIYGCTTAGGTYLPVHERVNTAPVQYQAVTIATSTSGAWAVLDAPPFRYLQFITSAVVSGGVSYTVTTFD